MSEILTESGAVNYDLAPFLDVPYLRSYYDPALGDRPEFMFRDSSAITLGQFLNRKYERDLNIIVVIPTRLEGDRIGGTLDRLWPLLKSGVVDKFMVLDATPEDGTRDVVLGRRSQNIEYVEERRALERYREVLTDSYQIEIDDMRGKGVAIALSVLEHHEENDLLFFVDADIPFTPEQILGLVIPVVTNDSTQMCFGSFERTTQAGNVLGPVVPGARVTKFTSRPAENIMHADSLGGESFEPLGGAYGGSAAAMARASSRSGKGIFACTYAIETRIGNYFRGLHATSAKHDVVPKHIYQEVFLGPRTQAGQTNDELAHMANAVIRGNLEDYLERHDLGVQLDATISVSAPVIELRSDGYAYALKRSVEKYVTFPPIHELKMAQLAYEPLLGT